MKQPPPGTAKERIREIVERQPDDSSFEEILTELAFVRMIEKGLADVDAGRMISHADVVRETVSWSK